MSYDKVDSGMQGVHTLLAMPQWYINYNLALLLANGTPEGQSLQQVSLAMAPGQPLWLKGLVKALRVVVYDPNRAAGVKFVVQFASGTMDYYDITQNPPAKETADISGLQFGFGVDLDLADLAADANLPADVKKRVAELLQNLGQGAFTVQQLLMDFQAAAIDEYDKDLTVFPPGFPPSASAAFPTYIRTYLAAVGAAGGNVLGYAITVNNPGGVPDPAASFPPTSLALQTDQYLNGPAGQPASLGPDLDTLCFLLMTGGAALPGTLSRSGWGNFVVPTDDDKGWYGTMAMNKTLFVDNFLLPGLGPLLTTYFALSDSDSSSLDAVKTVQTGALAPSSLGGTWTSGTQSSHSHVTNKLSNDDAYFNFSVSVSLQVEPGQNLIQITRNTDFDVHYVHWYGIEGLAVKSEFRVWYHVPLTITIQMQGVAAGQLAVQVTSQTNQPDPNTSYSDPYGWDITKTDGDYSTWANVSETMDQVINDFVALAIPQGLLPGIQDAIVNKLTLHPFVFPGGNQLFMKTPIFNNEGDLLVGLSYK